MSRSENQSQRTLLMARGIPDGSLIGGNGFVISLASDPNGVLFNAIAGNDVGGGAGFGPVLVTSLFNGAVAPQNYSVTSRFLGVTNFPSELDAVAGFYFPADSFTIIDAIAPTADLQKTSQINFPYGFNGATFDRVRLISDVNAAAANADGVQAVSGPAQWAENDAPAAAAGASATRAAGGAGTRLIVQSITATIGAVGTASGIVEFRLRDGAGGTILWRGKVSVPINGFAEITPAGLNIPMSTNTAAVLESDAGAAATEITVAMSGIQVT